LSANAAEIMRSSLDNLGSDFADEIQRKVEVAYPPQPLFGDENWEKFADGGPMRMAFVGADVYRKGGFELLRVVDRLLGSGADLHLTFVGSLAPRVENRPWQTVARERGVAIRSIIEKHPAQIKYHDRLDHKEVVRLFQNSHLSLLPSFQDTFGFVVLESQAAICPVITTNQRVFPEINSQNEGWVIQLPTNKSGEVSFRESDFPELSKKLEFGLSETLADILNSGIKAIKPKAENALKQIITRHDPDLTGEQIFRWY
jgi:glycosyltransferase involved in cell wall biosynthesis